MTQLTVRQERFLQLLCEGHRAVDLTELTGWSNNVVFRELQKAQRKLGANTNTQAAVIYHNSKLTSMIKSHAQSDCKCYFCLDAKKLMENIKGE